MSVSEHQRYAGVEDEFRVTTMGRPIYVDELFSKCRRFFFDESGHVPIFEPVPDPDTIGGRIWTWYGGTFYHDYDSLGPLIEATTPLTSLDKGMEALVDNVLAQRAQLLELGRGADVLGVSTHANLLLDSHFQGQDLCEFKTAVPSNAFVSAEAQKLGADIALVAAHTISPVIAYLLFNHKPRKGALYRPRKRRRIELCLPYVPEPDQMRVGLLVWFAAVDYITDLIKADLGEHKDWAARYQNPEYYRVILSKFPFVVSNVKFRRPDFYLGYEIDGGMEEAVMLHGSSASIETEGGDINIVDLAKACVELFSEKLASMATRTQLSLLEDFLGGRRELSVDLKEAPESFHLDHAYIKRLTGKDASGYLNKHEVDELASVHLKFLRSPLRTIKPCSRISPCRVARNLGKEVEWDFINLELVEERESVVKRYLLEVPLYQADHYLKLEENFTNSEAFFDAISPWIRATTTIPNPRRIFAYGTLTNPRRDRHRFGVTVTSVRSASAYGEAYDFGDYPVLVENSRTSVVPGVVLSLLDFEEAGSKFDFYEGCHYPNPLFVRALRQVILDHAEIATSWVYVGNMNNRLVREKLKTAQRLSEAWAKVCMRPAANNDLR